MQDQASQGAQERVHKEDAYSINPFLEKLEKTGPKSWGKHYRLVSNMQIYQYPYLKEEPRVLYLRL